MIVKSLDKEGVEDARKLKVVDKRTDNDTVPTRIIDFSGEAAQKVFNLQKFVDRYTK